MTHNVVGIGISATIAVCYRVALKQNTRFLSIIDVEGELLSAQTSRGFDKAMAAAIALRLMNFRREVMLIDE
jgi:hypothetical protein